MYALKMGMCCPIAAYLTIDFNTLRKFYKAKLDLAKVRARKNANYFI